MAIIKKSFVKKAVYGAVAASALAAGSWLAYEANSYANLKPETAGNRNKEYLALDISKPTFPGYIRGTGRRNPRLVAILDLRMVGHENSEIPRDEQLGIGPSLENLIDACWNRKDLDWEVFYESGVENNPSYIDLIKLYNGKPATSEQLEIMKSLNFRGLLPFKPKNVYR